MDKRIAKSQAAILGAFRHLIFQQSYDAIRIKDLIATAGVARSTFYEHFPDKRAVLIASMGHLLDTLSKCAGGSATRDDVESLVAHMWENRNLGRIIFNSNAMDHIVRALTDCIARETHRSRLECFAMAYSFLGTIKEWLSGDFHADSSEVTSWLLST